MKFQLTAFPQWTAKAVTCAMCLLRYTTYQGLCYSGQDARRYEVLKKKSLAWVETFRQLRDAVRTVELGRACLQAILVSHLCGESLGRAGGAARPRPVCDHSMQHELRKRMIKIVAQGG